MEKQSRAETRLSQLGVWAEEPQRCRTQAVPALLPPWAVLSCLWGHSHMRRAASGLLRGFSHLPCQFHSSTVPPSPPLSPGAERGLGGEVGGGATKRPHQEGRPQSARPQARSSRSAAGMGSLQ